MVCSQARSGHQIIGRKCGTFSQESSSTLSLKALSVSNLKEDRGRNKREKLENVIQREKLLDKYDEKPFIQEATSIEKKQNTFSLCQSAFVYTVHQRGTRAEGQGADEPEKRQLRCYSKESHLSSSIPNHRCAPLWFQV